MEGRERKKITYSRLPPPTPVFPSAVNDISVYPVTHNKNVAPREMADSRIGAGKTQNEPEASYGDERKEEKEKRIGTSMSKGYKNQPERTLNDQSWNNFSK